MMTFVLGYTYSHSHNIQVSSTGQLLLGVSYACLPPTPRTHVVSNSKPSSSAPKYERLTGKRQLTAATPRYVDTRIKCLLQNLVYVRLLFNFHFSEVRKWRLHISVNNNKYHEYFKILKERCR